ncbi:MAG: VOC family protein [Oscillospiraceae bacterium]|nr:VOC family protein [Oscillospiraceae bacterium]
MEYRGTLISVREMDRSIRFYTDVLGLSVTADYGANVTMDGWIYLQTEETWKGFIGERQILYGGNACELYFEEEEMDRFLRKLKTLDVSYVHTPLQHRWGQRVVRFLDPDGHIIEVGEKMENVVRRFASYGMTPGEIALKMDVPEDFVYSALGEAQPV